MSDAPSFPPLLRGRADAAPRDAALDEARAGCDPGLILWRGGDALEAALVLAPEVPRGRAAQMLPLAAVALRDALGAIGPAELPVHLTWDGRVMLDGAEAGRVRAIAPSGVEDAPPDWLVVHLSLRFRSGDGPDTTALWEEGGGEVTPEALLESWSRHLLHRLSQWEDGPRALHAELVAASWERAAATPGHLGLDEDLGRLRRDGDGTRLDPLTDLLDAP